MDDALEVIATEDRRLTILRLLRESAEYVRGEPVLGKQLRACGHPVTADRLRVDLSWLAEQGLVRLEENDPHWVAVLLTRGAAVAAGTCSVPGVARPDSAR